MTKSCSVVDCLRPHKGHGFCKFHLRRVRSHGDPLVARAPQKAQTFIAKAIAYKGNECLVWPYALANGYARFGNATASRFVCIAIHDRPPSPQHHALHSCDNPKCVTPRHLHWGTPSQNAIESLRRRRQPSAKMTPTKVRQMRKLHSSGASQRKIAAMFNMSITQTSRILKRQTWAWV